MPATTPNARSIFDCALEIESAAERQAYLEEACSGAPETRAQVEALLAAHAAAGSFLESPCVPALSGTNPTTDQPAERPGAQLGPYKLLQQIGEGGMGVVFMAEQHEPVKRRVALKIIKPGMDSRHVIARFEAERQALSLMDHPNIAKVLDAGTTGSGRPYFVMELVKGQPITQYCDEHHLTPRQRLELLLPVCQAIQHAHQKGIIHRDIKPTNILVAEYDNQPVPKVIDFGVAKAVSQSLTEKTMFTGFGQIVGTLEYMSPEQARVNQLDIDTRSDIYSLGVLLYELLTGSTPFNKNRLRSAAWDEMLRIIREEEPEKPSTRLSSVGSAHNQSARSEAVGTAHPTLASIAAVRSTEPAKLARLVRGELDWIVMKALEKDRNRRYETANGFAADIQRYLADEPVLACPPSATYRFKKFALRNRIALATASAALAGLLVLVVGLAVSNRMITASRNETAKALHDKSEALIAAKKSAAQAEAERKRAEANFLRARIAVRDAVMLPAVGHAEWSKLPEPLRKKFEDIAAKFYESLIHAESADPALRYESAVGYRSLGNLYSRTGRQEQAEGMLRKSIAMLDEVVAEAPANPAFRRQLAESLFFYWSVLRRSSSEDAYSAAERTLEVIGRLVEEHPQDGEYAAAAELYYVRIGSWLRIQGRTEESDRVAQLLSDLRERNPQQATAPQAMPSASDALTLAKYHLDDGRPQEAPDLIQRAISLKPQDDATWYAAAALYRYMGDPERCRKTCEAMLARFESIAAADPEVANRIIQTCTFSPNALADFPRVENLADRAITDQEVPDYYRSSVLAKALTAYRARRYDQAVEWVKKFAPTSKQWELDGSAFAVLAMAQYQLRQEEAAFATLDSAQVIFAKRGTDPEWLDWLPCELLIGEAQMLLGAIPEEELALNRPRKAAQQSSEQAAADAAAPAEQTAGRLRLLRRLAGHSEVVRALAFLPDEGGILSVSRDRTARIWDVKTGSAISSFAIEGYLKAADISADFRRLATTFNNAENDPRAQIWDLEQRRRLHDMSLDAGWTESIRIAPDNARLVTLGQPRGGRLWNSITGEQLKRLEVPFSFSAAFSPDGRSLAIGTTGQIWLYESQSGNSVWELRVPSDRNVEDLHFSPDGSLLAAGQQGGDIRLVDVASGEVVQSLKDSGSAILRIRFLPGGRHLLATDSGGALRLWDLGQGKMVASARTMRGTNEILAISPDGRRALTASGELWNQEAGRSLPNGDYAIRLWQLPEFAWSAESSPAPKSPP